MKIGQKVTNQYIAAGNIQNTTVVEITPDYIVVEILWVNGETSKSVWKEHELVAIDEPIDKNFVPGRLAVCYHNEKRLIPLYAFDVWKDAVKYENSIIENSNSLTHKNVGIFTIKTNSGQIIYEFGYQI